MKFGKGGVRLRDTGAAAEGTFIAGSQWRQVFEFTMPKVVDGSVVQTPESLENWTLTAKAEYRHGEFSDDDKLLRTDGLDRGNWYGPRRQRHSHENQHDRNRVREERRPDGQPRRLHARYAEGHTLVRHKAGIDSAGH